MTKNYKKLALILSMGFIGMSAFAQGTWKASGTEATVNNGVAIETGIFNLTVMHTDAGAAFVIGKTDAGAPTVSYNGIDWDNQGIIQGGTNGMYYAIKPAINGTLDISIKMGSGKATFVAELADSYATDLVTLTTVTNPISASVTRATSFFATATNYVLPQVYDTYNKTTGTWDGSVAIQSSGSNQYLVMSFPVTANKIYAVGCFGSKLMLRGINFALPAGISQVLADKGITFNGKEITNQNSLSIEVYNVLGKKVAVSTSNISTANFAKGVYLVKAVGSAGTLKITI